MGQMIQINLDGGKLEMDLLRGVGPERIVELDHSEVGFALLEGGMLSGAHSAAFFARLPDGRIAMLELTQNNLMGVLSAVRGKLIERGVIPVDVNPAIAFYADREKRCIEFTSEAPLKNWRYTLDHAKKFWRLLRQFCEDAGR